MASVLQYPTSKFNCSILDLFCGAIVHQMLLQEVIRYTYEHDHIYRMWLTFKPWNSTHYSHTATIHTLAVVSYMKQCCCFYTRET